MNIETKKLSYSAILCAYNAEETIAGAINSVLNQNIKPINFIIVDDASTDKTAQVIKSFCEKHQDIEPIFLPKNLGQSAARNIASRRSLGDVLIFFDDDDISLSNRASLHLRMHLNSQLSYVSSIKIYSNGYKVENINNDVSLKPDTNAWVKKLITGNADSELQNLWIPCSTCAIDRDFFESINGFDEGMRRLEDVEMFIKGTLKKPTVSWSQVVAVNRFDTFGKDKGGAIDVGYEKILLQEYQSFFTTDELKKIDKALKFREAYFEKKKLHLFIFALKNIKFLLTDPRKIHRYFMRIVHDLRKGRK